MATKSTAAKPKPAVKKASPSKAKPAAAKPVKKTAPAKAKPATAKAANKIGTKYSCSVCGLVVTVDTVCNCVDVCDLVCCSKPMKVVRK